MTTGICPVCEATTEGGCYCTGPRLPVWHNLFQRLWSVAAHNVDSYDKNAWKELESLLYAEPPKPKLRGSVEKHAVRLTEVYLRAHSASRATLGNGAWMNAHHEIAMLLVQQALNEAILAEWLKPEGEAGKSGETHRPVPRQNTLQLQDVPDGRWFRFTAEEATEGTRRADVSYQKLGASPLVGDSCTAFQDLRGYKHDAFSTRRVYLVDPPCPT